MKERERLGSRLGFILISAGCSYRNRKCMEVPLYGRSGRRWRFRVILPSFPVNSRTSYYDNGICSWKSYCKPGKAYYALEKPGQKWHIHGYITLIGCYLLMMFYTTVAGWMLHYFYLTATGKFTV